jgi:hypothetical protein
VSCLRSPSVVPPRRLPRPVRSSLAALAPVLPSYGRPAGGLSGAGDPGTPGGGDRQPTRRAARTHGGPRMAMPPAVGRAPPPTRPFPIRPHREGAVHGDRQARCAIPPR